MRLGRMYSRGNHQVSAAFHASDETGLVPLSLALAAHRARGFFRFEPCLRYFATVRRGSSAGASDRANRGLDCGWRV
jgi:hypothetical protein